MASTSIHNIKKKQYRLGLLLLLFYILLAETALPRDHIRIMAGGDVMLGSWAEEVIRRHGWDYPFRRLDSILTDNDLFIVNLEAPFGKGDSAFEKTYTFQVAPDLVQVLQAGRINMVSLANNHILDFGPENLFKTMETLKQHNIKYSGAGMSLAEARLPAVIQRGENKIALASYSLTFPEEFWATDSTAGTCFPYHTFFYNDLRKFRAECDLVIVSFHWGGELMNSPKEYQIELAHKAIDAGADLILGHHPHVVQGIELYKGKIIAYSLGNFVFGSYSEKARESMLLKFFAGTEGIERCKIYPISVYNKDIEFQPRLLETWEKTGFIRQLNILSQELNGDRIVINDAGWIEM